MTTYYVNKNHPSASNSNAGTSASLPWLTLAKATATVAAGDTVHIAGFYRETMTLATSGSSGSPIIWNFDVKGEYVGSAYAGMHGITAHDSDNAAATRASCLNINEKTFNEIRNAIFLGGTTAPVIDIGASNKALEGTLLQGCVAQSSASTFAMKVDVNAGVTPTTNGLRLLGCVLMGGLDIDWDSNGTSNKDLKWLVSGCYIDGIASLHGVQMDRVTNSGSFSIGGIEIFNNEIHSYTYPIGGTNMVNTSKPIKIFNNLIFGGTSVSPISFVNGTDGGAIGDFNVCCAGAALAASNYLDGGNSKSRVIALVGGFHDIASRRNSGYSPYSMFEPMTLSGYTNPAIDTGGPYSLNTVDMLGNSRAMGRPRSPIYYIINGWSLAVTDPNSVWNNDTFITNGDLTDSAYTLTNGSSSSNYIRAGGTTIQDRSASIVAVKARIATSSNSGTATVGCQIETAGGAEVLGTITFGTSSGSADLSSWVTLSTPTGGWTGKLGTLEFRAWKVSGAAALGIYYVQLSVETVESVPDIGAVEARTQPVVQSAVTHYESYAARFDGAGYQDDFAAVGAGTQTTISIWTRWDSNYSGSKPRLVVRNIPGVADQEAVATGSANTWEQLSVSFAATADAFVLVRYESRDVSTSGVCYFADETVAI